MLGAKVYIYSSLTNEKGFWLVPEIAYSQLQQIHQFKYIVPSDGTNGIKHGLMRKQLRVFIIGLSHHKLEG